MRARGYIRKLHIFTLGFLCDFGGPRRTGEYLAFAGGKYASADLVGSGARCTASSGTGSCYDAQPFIKDPETTL
jgi:hypothetical protein